MKPLLRAVLIVDTALYASSGAALLLSPLAGVQRVLQLTQIQPAMVGQMLGLALLGLAWLSLRGAFDGAMTIGVAKVVGHVTWLAGALVLAWSIGLHVLWMPALGVVPNVLIGGLLIVVGLGGARFAGAVRRREIAKAAQASGNGGKTKGRAAAEAPASAAPVEPVLRPFESSAATGGTAPNASSTRIERPFAGSPEPDARASEASSASAPRPPFHG